MFVFGRKPEYPEETHLSDVVTTCDVLKIILFQLLIMNR